MKKIKMVSSIILLVAFLSACNPDHNETQVPLSASKTNSIKLGEPVLFTMDQAAATSNVKWMVSPDAKTKINVSGNKAAVMFGAKGNYSVTATFEGTQASKSVTVTDTAYSTSAVAASTVPFVSSEKLNITVSRIDSGSKSGLLFTAVTTTLYTCINNSLITSFTYASNVVDIKYDGVAVPGNCTTGTAAAAGFSSIYPISEGTAALKISFKGVTYTGTIVNTNNKYTITWSDNSIVALSPLTL